jgi:hypothetical protein
MDALDGTPVEEVKASINKRLQTIAKTWGDQVCVCVCVCVYDKCCCVVRCIYMCM